MIVDDRKVYHPVWVLWDNLFMDSAYEPHSVRDQPRGEVWIPYPAISPVVKVKSSNPIVRKSWFELAQVTQQHSRCLLVIVNKEDPVIL